jgi:sulfatase modifying factor 1
MNLKNLVILFSCAAAITSCKEGGLFAKKMQQSEVTGWNYNDKNMGGYQVPVSCSFRVVLSPWVPLRRM